MDAGFRTLERVPPATLEWLLAEDNPAVAVLTRRVLLGEKDSGETRALWARRNEYPPVAMILAAIDNEGKWTTPGRDYNKYGGNMWQIHFLGELWADPTDARIQAAAEYAFSRQLPDGSWSVNGRPTAAISCLTANVGRALARLGHARDERVFAIHAHLDRDVGLPRARINPRVVDRERVPEPGPGPEPPAYRRYRRARDLRG